MSGEEAKLIQQAKNGNQRAVAKIYDSHYPSVFNYVYYRVANQQIAEDLTAEVFIRMIDRLDTFDYQGKTILAWLYTIAHNLVVDHHRNNDKAEHFPLKEDLLPIKSNNPVVKINAMLTRECLSRALSHLTELQRKVILLKIIDERKTKDIAGILNKTEQAIRALQHRGLASLERAMGKENCL